jgi:hypothetical protein
MLTAKRRQALLRRLTVWDGLLCLSAQFASALHMVLVEHVRCAEHGELVHADGEHDADHAGADQRDVSSDGPTISSSSGDADHGHDHCLICSERRKLTLLPTAIPELLAPEVSNLLLALCPDASLYTSRVYSYAPKTSPPV